MGKRDGTYFEASTAAPLQLIWVANRTLLGIKKEEDADQQS